MPLTPLPSGTFLHQTSTDGLLPPLPPRPQARNLGDDASTRPNRTSTAGDGKQRLAMVKKMQNLQVKEALKQGIEAADDGSATPPHLRELTTCLEAVEKDKDAKDVLANAATADKLLRSLAFDASESPRAELQAILRPEATSRPDTGGRDLGALANELHGMLEDPENQQFLSSVFAARNMADPEEVRAFNKLLTDLDHSLATPASGEEQHKAVEFALNELFHPLMEFAEEMTDETKRRDFVVLSNPADPGACESRLMGIAAEFQSKCDHTTMSYFERLKDEFSALPAPPTRGPDTTDTTGTQGPNQPPLTSIEQCKADVTAAFNTFLSVLPQSTREKLSSNITNANAHLSANRYAGVQFEAHEMMLNAAQAAPLSPQAQQSATALLDATSRLTAAGASLNTSTAISLAQGELKSMKDHTVPLLAKLGILSSTNVAQLNGSIDDLDRKLTSATTDAEKRQACINANSFIGWMADKGKQTLHDEPFCKSFLDKIGDATERKQVKDQIDSFRKQYPIGAPNQFGPNGTGPNGTGPNGAPNGNVPNGGSADGFANDPRFSCLPPHLREKAIAKEQQMREELQFAQLIHEMTMFSKIMKAFNEIAERAI
jgi:hypothetical protein